MSKKSSTTFAEALSALLTHPDIPADLYNGIRDHISIRDDVVNSSAYLSLLFDSKSTKATGEASGQSNDEHLQAEIFEAAKRRRSLDFDYQPITPDEADRLAEQIVPFDEDEIAWAFIRLLHGIAYAGYKDPQDLERIVDYATRRAYSTTFHHHDSFHEFALINQENSDGLRVLRRDLTESEGSEDA